jgi:uncharacterized membrane protein
MFVALVHRLSRLQIQSILIFAAQCGRKVIETLYPPLAGTAGPIGPPEHRWAPITQVLVERGEPRTIQAIDTAALVELARNTGGIIEVISAVGDTIGEGIVLLQVYGSKTRIPEAALNRAFIRGDERTFEQDPKYALYILVDIAIRALSPAVNDPGTAVQALDQIEDLLMRLGQKRLDIGDIHDQNGELRVVMPCPQWEDFLTLAIEEIRHYGRDSMKVTRRLRALLANLAETLPAQRRRALRREQERLEALINRTFEEDEEIMLASVEDRQGFGSPRKHGMA